MRMKRITAILLVVLTVFCMTACSGLLRNVTNSSKTEKPTYEETEKKAVKTPTETATKAEPTESKETEPAPETEKQETEKKETDQIDPEFKEAMDSYESFMKEYCDFMKKYMANPMDTTLLMNYTTYLSKYEELAKKIDAMDANSMNTAEAAYYLEVQSRVSKMLMEIGG